MVGLPLSYQTRVLGGRFVGVYRQYGVDQLEMLHRFQQYSVQAEHFIFPRPRLNTPLSHQQRVDECGRTELDAAKIQEQHVGPVTFNEANQILLELNILPGIEVSRVGKADDHCVSHCSTANESHSIRGDFFQSLRHNRFALRPTGAPAEDDSDVRARTLTTTTVMSSLGFCGGHVRMRHGERLR